MEGASSTQVVEEPPKMLLSIGKTHYHTLWENSWSIGQINHLDIGKLIYFCFVSSSCFSLKRSRFILKLFNLSF